MNCKLIYILLISHFVHETTSFFGKKNLKMLKEKAKNYYKSKFKKKGLNFLGYDLSEYQGANAQYRNENSNKWQEYYECLSIQKNLMGVHKTFAPEALQRLEGSSVKLECKICLNPSERDKLDSIEWDYGHIGSDYISSVEFNEHIFISPEDKTLHIYNLNEGNSGQYVCRIGQTITAPYFLTVTKISENLTEVHEPGALEGPYPTPPIFLAKYNLQAQINWGEWSPCSKCGKVGKKHKFGYWVIGRAPEHSEKIKKSQTYTSTERISVTDDDTKLINLFATGIPYQSHILPKSFISLPELQNVTNEIMTKYCKEACPESIIFQVKDKNGKTLETANNSAGIYSLLQSLPPSEPPVKRIIQYEIKGSKIKITCPGNKNNDMPVHWQMNNKNIIPELLSKESNKRLYVSVTDAIYIKDSRISDSSLFSCWQGDELVGSIQLVVEDKITLNFNQHIMLLGMVIILSTFSYVYIKAFFGQKYART